MAFATYNDLERILKGRRGTFVINGTTPVVVADKRVTANSVLERTLQTIGGTPAATIIQSKTPGVGFTVVGAAGDSSTYVYNVMG